MNAQTWLSISEEVQAATSRNHAVVALESTIISHGMPYPQNVETARSLEAIIRSEGAVPATIGLIDGKICIGLDDEALERLGRDPNVIKVSRRDLPYILSQNKTGATTVAATMICAALAGIRIFATGGIGGVHLDGENSLDISADLQELSQTNVAVICAGVKSILDIGRTLEVLETLGVPVIGYGSDAFPAFYTRDSGFGVDYRLNTPEDVAALLETKWTLGLNGGILLANPVPEGDAMPDLDIKRAIDTALAEADNAGVQGKDVTPFLLGRIKDLTGGNSLQTNIALVENNARVAAQIAIARAERRS